MSGTITTTGTNYNVTALSDALRAVYSREILFQAQPVLRFDQFAVVKTELNTEPGKEIKVMSYTNLPPGGELTEGVHIRTNKLSTNLVSITVKEYGNAIAVSNMLLQTSFDDTMAAATRLLGFDYAKTLDGVLRDVVLSGTNVVYGGQKSARADLTSSDVFDTTCIKDAVEILATNNAPKIPAQPGAYAGAGVRSAYVCFAHPHQLRSLRDDRNWLEASKYGDPSLQFRGEVGRYEDVVFIETTQMPIISSSPLAEVYQAVIIGLDAYALAFGLPVEIRDNGVQDFGREHALAWYSIFGAGILEDSRIVRIETA
jgi:N4-gp56 family major capsid protein